MKRTLSKAKLLIASSFSITLNGYASDLIELRYIDDEMHEVSISWSENTLIYAKQSKGGYIIRQQVESDEIGDALSGLPRTPNSNEEVCDNGFRATSLNNGTLTPICLIEPDFSEWVKIIDNYL